MLPVIGEQAPSAESAANFISHSRPCQEQIEHLSPNLHIAVVDCK